MNRNTDPNFSTPAGAAAAADAAAADDAQAAEMAAAGMIEEGADILVAFGYLVELAKKHAASNDHPTPMEQLLEQMLAESSADLPESEEPTVACQIVFKDGSALGSAVKRGPLPRTYVIASPASRQGPRGEQIMVPDKLVEVSFHGTDILRIAALRDVPAALHVPDRRIVMPG